MTCHRVIADGCISERILLITWIHVVSISQQSIEFYMLVMVCLKEKV